MYAVYQLCTRGNELVDLDIVRKNDDEEPGWFWQRDKVGTAALVFDATFLLFTILAVSLSKFSKIKRIIIGSCGIFVLGSNSLLKIYDLISSCNQPTEKQLREKW